MPPRYYDDNYFTNGENDDDFRAKIKALTEKVQYLNNKEKPTTMHFSDLSVNERISYMKREFSALIKSIFENPELLKSFIDQKRISNDQGKIVLSIINSLNSKSCVCCRKFDATKLRTTPIERELEPLLDIAQTTVKEKRF